MRQGRRGCVASSDDHKQTVTNEPSGVFVNGVVAFFFGLDQPAKKVWRVGNALCSWVSQIPGIRCVRMYEPAYEQRLCLRHTL